MKRALCALALAAAGGCAAGAALDVIQVGPWFPARRASEVEVFSSREETSRPWGGIAVIHGDRVPSGDAGRLEKQRSAARRLAAKAGSDAVIITVQPGHTDLPPGTFEPEVFLSALAIRYVDAVSTDTAR